MPCLAVNQNRILYIIFFLRKQRWTYSIQNYWVNTFGNNLYNNQLSLGTKYMAILVKRDISLFNIIVYNMINKSKLPFAVINSHDFERDDYYINGMYIELKNQTKKSFLHIFYQTEKNEYIYKNFMVKTIQLQRIKLSVEIDKLNGVTFIPFKIYTSPTEFQKFKFTIILDAKVKLEYITFIL